MGEREFTGGERILKEKLEKLGLGTGMSGFYSREYEGAKKLLPEEAVMRLVDNLESSVVKAEAM